jgi:hypothetical protein
MISPFKLTLAVIPLLAGVATAAPHSKRNTAITDGSIVNGKSYDYVVAGGGLGGVVLAARLSEDSSRTVLIIEAGYDQENNPDVTGECPSFPSGPLLPILTHS